MFLAPPAVVGPPGPQLAMGALVPVLVGTAVLGILRFTRTYRTEKNRAQGAPFLIDTVLTTSREWLWALDNQGLFTFSSKISVTILGYQPWELVGTSVRLLVEPEDLALARAAVRDRRHPDDHIRAGVILRCRHRDGSQVLMDVAGKIRPAGDGHNGGFEGTARILPPQTVVEAATASSRARIREIVSGNMVLTAFQPIHDLTSGALIGAEALSRFVTEDGSGPDFWFAEATAVGLGAELEFAALSSALKAAEDLPANVYVALNISPESCLDPLLPGLLTASVLPLGRIVLELTERLPVEEYDALSSVLAPLRSHGLLIAVDDAGSGFASMRHILHLRPDIINWTAASSLASTTAPVSGPSEKPWSNLPNTFGRPWSPKESNFTLNSMP